MPVTASPCPRCGHPQATRTQGLSLIAECTRCGWMVATTNPDHPFHDRNPYTVRVRAPGIAPKMAIARLSATLGTGIAAARAIIEQDAPVAQDVLAHEVIRLHQLLRAQGLALEVSPAFPWDWDGDL